MLSIGIFSYPIMENTRKQNKRITLNRTEKTCVTEAEITGPKQCMALLWFKKGPMIYSLFYSDVTDTIMRK